ncbi:hypothetical protein ESCO_005507 [Escovopsis weberi]|uniref:Arrestin-like N-terminal domain-containing protein n=1 Tax=Escovopsis weberi TaxID=150374 RepID=A0A0M8N5U4_ESCWE|nr:hypothetical protein ESCO_005507 [Escovopsis weberi]
MSIRISLDNPPEFYTNLDVISGKILLNLSRTEQISAIVVKLEGESVTALTVPRNYDASRDIIPPGPPGSISTENHKVLYKLQKVFPDDYYASSSNPYGAFPLPAGQHEFSFRLKLPLNNACGDSAAMARIGGVTGLGGYGSGAGLFGMGGVRVMDGTKQLYLKHTTSTLPPSLTGFPMEAEIRYYIKVTVQRPGFLKENWRSEIGFKFLPIEPPRPVVTGQEAFARRPFTFRRRSSTFFSGSGANPRSSSNSSSSAASGPDEAAPSVSVSAMLPHPPTLTCNQTIPLRLVSKKLVDSHEQVYLVSLQVDLIGVTTIRSHGMQAAKTNRFVVVSESNLHIPLGSPDDGKDHEFEIPRDLWKDRRLPNTVAPSFTTCNLSRRYEIELKIGVSWAKPKSGGLLSSSRETFNTFQTIYLPLHFASVSVFSGITPPPELVAAARSVRPGRVTLTVGPPLPPRRHSHSSAAPPPSSTASPHPQNRPHAHPEQQQQQQQPPPRPPRQEPDPLYPPQLLPGQEAPPYDDAPPSYDEAMAENLSGLFDGLRPRPAYSGVTNENGPSQMPTEKS